MKYQLFHFHAGSEALRTGIVVGAHWYDLNTIAVALKQRSVAGLSIDILLEKWQEVAASLAAMALDIAENSSRFESALLDSKRIKFAPLLTQPGVIYGAGANYRDHVEAMGRAFNMKLALDPRSEGIAPWHFIKAGRGTLAAHQEAVAMPAYTKMLDWEAELAVIIGRRARNVAVDAALGFVAGYSCSNDLSARDNLRRDNVDVSSPFRFDWIGHKCFTGSCPLGPLFTPAQFVGSPENLGIKLWVNGELKQDSNTSNHLYNVAEQISYLSGRLELFPGDVVLSGTPAGVGMETQTFLKRGDTLRVWIEGLGDLENRIV